MFTPVNYTLVTVVLLGPIAWGHRPKYFKVFIAKQADCVTEWNLTCSVAGGGRNPLCLSRST